MIRVGVVLAGSKSSHGSRQSLDALSRRAVVDRALGKLGRQVDILLLNRADRPANIDESVTLVSDQHSGFQGPLAGVHSALSFMAEQRLGDAVLFTVPVDSPFIPMNLVTRLSQADQPVAFASSQGSGTQYSRVGLRALCQSLIQPCAKTSVKSTAWHPS